jgi:hypothetical protein
MAKSVMKAWRLERFGRALTLEDVPVPEVRPGTRVGPHRGVTAFVVPQTLLTKQLELLCELVPTAATVTFLVNPNNPNTVGRTREMQEIARALGRQLQVIVPPPTHSSAATANNSSCWRHGMQFPPVIHFASTPRPAA